MLTVNPTAAYHIKGFVKLYPVDFILHTGAAVSLLNTQLWDRINGLCNKLAELHKPELVGVEGAPNTVCGTTKLNVDFNGQTFIMNVVVADMGKT